MNLARVALVALAALLASPARAAGWPDLSSPPAARGGGEEDAALVVGIEQYSDAPKVDGAVQNAEDWYAFLTRTRGVKPSNVTLLRNREGTVEKLKKYAVEAAAKAGPKGTVWFVFVGHGAPARDGKDGVLVGYDAQQEADSLYARSVAQHELLDLLGAGKARLVAVVDACFSGRTSQGELVKGLQPLIAVQAAAVPRGLVLTAGKADQFAGPLPGASRPAFSYLVLGALRGWGDQDKDGKVTATEAIGYARDALSTVVKDRTQTPELSGAAADDVLAQGSEAGPDLGALVLARKPTGGSELTFGQESDIRVPRIEVTSVGGLADINMQAEQGLEKALDAEESKTAKAEDKAAAWCALAALTDRNPYAAKAKEGCRAWRLYGAAKRARQVALVEDFHTLAGYLRLKRKTAAQKQSALEAFLAAHRSEPESEKVKAVQASRATLDAGQEVQLADEVERFKSDCDGRKSGEACALLATLNAKGIWPLNRDGAEAERRFGRACDLGYLPGCAELGGLLAARDPKLAMQPLQRACTGGEGAGCTALAWLAWTGRGVGRNLAQAVQQFEQGCELGDGAGCVQLGVMLDAGQGTTVDPARAAQAFERACDAGASDGCLRLANAYVGGRGVPANLDRGVELYGRSCDTGVAASCGVAADLALRPPKKDAALAAQYRQKACDLGEAAACATKSEPATAATPAPSAAAPVAKAEPKVQATGGRSDTATWRYAGFGAIGAGALLAIAGGGGVGYLAWDKSDEVERLGPQGYSTPSAYAEALDESRTYGTVALGLGLGGAAIAAVGAYLVLTNDDAPATLTFAPRAGGGVAAASVRW